MNDNIKPKLIKWHFCLLGFLLLSFCTGIITGYRWNSDVILCLKLALYLSGIILFFKTLKPLRLITFYFSFYPFSITVLVFAFSVGGIFLAILASFLLAPIYPKQTIYENQTIKIYDAFQGFMSPCCLYEVVEPKLYVFEKRLGFINIETPIDPTNDEFRVYSNSIIYTYKIEEYSHNNQTKTIRDTSKILRLKK